MNRTGCYLFYPGELCKDLASRPIPDFSKKRKNSTNETENKKRRIGGFEWTPPQIVEVPAKAKPVKPARSAKPKKKTVMSIHLEKFVEYLTRREISHQVHSDEIPNMDVSFHFDGNEYRAAVLGRQKIRLNEETEQDDYFWFLLQPTKQSEQSYLLDPNIDVVVQQIFDGFLIFRRKELAEFIFEKIPLKGKRMSDPNDSVYKRFGIGRRRETHTLIPRQDLECNAGLVLEIPSVTCK